MQMQQPHNLRFFGYHSADTRIWGFNLPKLNQSCRCTVDITLCVQRSTNEIRTIGYHWLSMSSTKRNPHGSAVLSSVPAAWATPAARR